MMKSSHIPQPKRGDFFARAAKFVVSLSTFVKVTAFSVSNTLRWIKDLPFFD